MVDDRSKVVPPGHVIKSGYVNVFKVRLACRERMAVGDVDKAFQKLLQSQPNQPHPAPLGYWDNDVFVIEDGRHQYVAALMLGYEFLFVEWLEMGL